MKYTTIIKDASRQVIGRVVSGLSGLVVVGMLTPLLGPLRFSDYSTILTFFAFWSAFADLGLYSMGLRELGKLKSEYGITDIHSFRSASQTIRDSISAALSKFVRSRLTQIAIVYTIVLAAGYCISSYFHNPYISWGLPIGMLFSALFMASGIIQLPLQLFRKMYHVSIALILARVSQVVFLVIVLYSGRWHFDIHAPIFPLSLFLLVLGSVLISSITQITYTTIVSNTLIPLRSVQYLRHMVSHIIKNGLYGLASVFDSFHLLIAGFLISVFYPTIKGYAYAGIWGLALQLIQVLLIIPASLANSVIHKISGLQQPQQLRSLGQLILIIVRCGSLFLSNFMIFSSHIIYFISGSKYLSSTGAVRNLSGLTQLLHSDILSQGVIGSDFVLAFLGIVIVLTFTSTAFSYVFIATGRQKLLFPINSASVAIGGIISIVLIYHYNIVGAIIAKIIMEILFDIGSFWYAFKYKLVPKIERSQLIMIIVFFVSMGMIGFVYPPISYTSKWGFVGVAMVYNILVFALRYKPLKGYFKSMTQYMNDKILENNNQSHFEENSV